MASAVSDLSADGSVNVMEGSTGTPRKSESLHALSHADSVRKVVRDFEIDCGIEGVPELENYYTRRCDDGVDVDELALMQSEKKDGDLDLKKELDRLRSSSITRKLSRQLSQEIFMEDVKRAVLQFEEEEEEERKTSPALGQVDEVHTAEDEDVLPCHAESDDEDEDESFCMVSMEEARSFIQGLRTRREQKKDELTLLGTPPTTTEFLELFREFAMCFASQVYDDGLELREVFDVNLLSARPTLHDESSLVERLASLSVELDALFCMDNLMKECVRVDGWKPHLVAPERCLREMTRKGIAMATGPVSESVDRVFSVLMRAKDRAMEKLEDKLVMRGRDAQKIIASSQDVIFSVLVGLLQEWREDSARSAADLIAMEECHLDTSFFSQRAEQRRREFEEQMKLTSQPGDVGDEAGGEAADGAASLSLMNTPKGGAASLPDGDINNAVSSTITSARSADPRQYRMGYMDKMNASGKKWKRRFFVLSERHGRLYIFHNPRERTAHATIDLKMCEIINHTDLEKGSQCKYGILLRAGGSENELEPRKAIYKGNRQSLLLRADNKQAQQQWQACLERARAHALAPDELGDDGDEPQEEADANAGPGEEHPNPQAAAFELNETILADSSRWIMYPAGLMPDEDLLRVAAQDARQYVLMAHEHIARTVPRLVVLQMISRAGGDEILSSLIARAAALPESTVAQALGEPVQRTVTRNALKSNLAVLEDAEQETEMIIRLTRRMTKGGVNAYGGGGGASGGGKKRTETAMVPIPTRIIDIAKEAH